MTNILCQKIPFLFHPWKKLSQTGTRISQRGVKPLSSILKISIASTANKNARKCLEELEKELARFDLKLGMQLPQIEAARLDDLKQGLAITYNGKKI